MKFGLTLPNRGVLFGAITPDRMLEMGEIADASDRFEYLWVGDSFFAKPRMESITLMAGLAARTARLQIGPACMASFPLRDPLLLAYQWASLDLLANGRMVLVACTGIVPQAGGAVEDAQYGVDNRRRAERLVEWIALLRRLWTEENVTFEGRHYRVHNVTIEPRPAAKPRPPIWIANNSRASRAVVERTHRRVAEYGDGWMTSLSDPDDVSWRLQDVRNKVREFGRDPDGFPTCLYHNINVNEDREAALAESKRFLDVYYTMDTPMDRVASWTATGSPEECAEHLRVYERMGMGSVALRCASWDQLAQLRRVIDEVLPRLQ